MRIAVVSETSARDKNPHIMAALEGRGHEVINAGMREDAVIPELTYLHTGFLAALLLNSKRVDLVVGGCGTGQGFLNSCMQYPNVFCGLILEPCDAWLFRQINGGNCIALALNKGYGWAGDVNLTFIFDHFFSVESGVGYPAHRKEAQRRSLTLLAALSLTTHVPFHEIVRRIDAEVLKPVLDFPDVLDLVDIATIENRPLRDALQARMDEGR